MAVLSRRIPGAHHSDGRSTACSTVPGLVQTRAEFERSQQAKVNQLVGLVYVLLALAILVALIGVINTLMLSVFERTHEIGLLRAVGMKRRQVRSMIRSESVVIALFGAVVGVLIGTALGIAMASSLRARASPTSWCPWQPDRVPDPVRAARTGCRRLAGSPGRPA